jgi:hypothetical protein
LTPKPYLAGGDEPGRPTPWRRCSASSQPGKTSRYSAAQVYRLGNSVDDRLDLGGKLLVLAGELVNLSRRVDVADFGIDATECRLDLLNHKVALVAATDRLTRLELRYKFMD